MTIKELNNRINELEQGQNIDFTYRGKTYELYCYDDERKNTTNNPGYSINRKGSMFHSMNVGKITSQYLTLYTFNMMDQKSQYKMSIEQMTLVEEETDS